SAWAFRRTVYPSITPATSILRMRSQQGEALRPTAWPICCMLARASACSTLRIFRSMASMPTLYRQSPTIPDGTSALVRERQNIRRISRASGRTISWSATGLPDSGGQLGASGLPPAGQPGGQPSRGVAGAGKGRLRGFLVEERPGQRAPRQRPHSLTDGRDVLGRRAAAAADDVDQALRRELAQQPRGVFRLL